jgi:hypothetical protein
MQPRLKHRLPMQPQPKKHLLKKHLPNKLLPKSIRTGFTQVEGGRIVVPALGMSFAGFRDPGLFAGRVANARTKVSPC